MVKTKEIAGADLGFTEPGDAFGLSSSTFTIHQDDGKVIAYPDRCALVGQSMADFLNRVAHVPSRNDETIRDLSFALRAILRLTNPNMISTRDGTSISLKRAHETSPHFGAAMQEFVDFNQPQWLNAIETGPADFTYRRLGGLRVFRSQAELVQLTIVEATSNILGVKEHNGLFGDEYRPQVRGIDILTFTLFGDGGHSFNNSLNGSEIAEEVRRQFMCFLADTPDSKKPNPNWPVNHLRGDLATAFHNKHTYQRQAELIIEFLEGLAAQDPESYQDFALRLGNNKGLVSVDLESRRGFNTQMQHDINLGIFNLDIDRQGRITIGHPGFYTAQIGTNKILLTGNPRDWEILATRYSKELATRVLVPVIAFDKEGFLNQPETNKVLQEAGVSLIGVPDVFLGRISIESRMSGGEKPLQQIDLPIERSQFREISPRELPIWVSTPIRSKMLLESEMVKALSS